MTLSAKKFDLTDATVVFDTLVKLVCVNMCRPTLRRRCVLNSQLVGDSLDESEQFADNEVELRRVGGVNAPVVSRDPVSIKAAKL